MKAQWKFIGSSVDGECFKIQGIDVWKHEWQKLDDRAKVKDPQYGQDFTFAIWRISAGNKTIDFAAGEFSNCIWGFYSKP